MLIQKVLNLNIKRDDYSEQGFCLLVWVGKKLTPSENIDQTETHLDSDAQHVKRDRCAILTVASAFQGTCQPSYCMWLLLQVSSRCSSELRVITAAIANDEPGLKPVQKMFRQNQTQ